MQSYLSIDVRTKIVLIITLGTILVTRYLEQSFNIWYWTLFVLPILVFLIEKQFKEALIYSLLIGSLIFLVKYQSIDFSNLTYLKDKPILMSV
ncbi:MAG: hypothetical protein N4Q32_04150, partial [Neisseriaceae bacterium]|nr:hypothetical protein [Neisseriaceae bacterium]